MRLKLKNIMLGKLLTICWKRKTSIPGMAYGGLEIRTLTTKMLQKLRTKREEKFGEGKNNEDGQKMDKGVNQW